MNLFFIKGILYKFAQVKDTTFFNTNKFYTISILKSSETIVAIAKKTIVTESKAITKLLDFINADFVKSVEKIYESKGRLIVTGIGKSAIIAQKIVATMNST